METVSEHEPTVATPGWLRGPRRYVVALLGAALFFTPAVARLAGVNPTAIENRPLVKLPSLSDGFGAFAVLTQWSIDHLPLRNLAVKADAHISQDIFGEPPTYGLAGGPVGIGQSAALQGGRAGAAEAARLALQVVAGRDGWLFLGEEFLNACQPELNLPRITAGITRLHQMLVASGRKLVLLVPPDKDTVDGRFLAPGSFDARCAAQSKAARWKAFDALGLPDVVDLRAPLATEERTSGTPAYLRIDTHWTSRAAATVFVPAILNMLSPSLYRTAQVKRVGPVGYVADLTALNGTPRYAFDDGWTVVRPGATAGTRTAVTPFKNYPITHYLNAARPGLPLVQGHTLIYGDSFAARSLDILAPFFADLTRVPEISAALAGRPADRASAIAQLASAMRQADVVIVEQTERIVFGSAKGSILAPDVLDALQRALATAPRGHGLSVG